MHSVQLLHSVQLVCSYSVDVVQCDLTRGGQAGGGEGLAGLGLGEDGGDVVAEGAGVEVAVRGEPQQPEGEAVRDCAVLLDVEQVASAHGLQRVQGLQPIRGQLCVWTNERSPGPGGSGPRSPEHSPRPRGGAAAAWRRTCHDEGHYEVIRRSLGGQG